MFAVRGVAVSLSAFFLLYIVFSLMVLLAWRGVRRFRAGCPARWFADLLFWLRISPLAAAIVVTAAFTVPSFILLEPHAIAEPLGAVPLVLGLGCVALLAAGAYKATVAVVRTSHVVADWVGGAPATTTDAAVPVFRTGSIAPALTVVGIRQPRVVLSEAGAAALSESELRTALQHEVAHVRRWDNLKKLMFRFCSFPGMSPLESAWLEAAEMAADDAAVSSLTEALDLAAALIKLSRISPARACPEIATGLLHGAAALVNARVERLIAWDDSRTQRSGERNWWYAAVPLLGVAVSLALTYSALISRVHMATEWLVR